MESGSRVEATAAGVVTAAGEGLEGLIAGTVAAAGEAMIVVVREATVAGAETSLVATQASTQAISHLWAKLILFPCSFSHLFCEMPQGEIPDRVLCGAVLPSNAKENIAGISHGSTCRTSFEKQFVLSLRFPVLTDTLSKTLLLTTLLSRHSKQTKCLIQYPNVYS